MNGTLLLDQARAHQVSPGLLIVAVLSLLALPFLAAACGPGMRPPVVEAGSGALRAQTDSPAPAPKPLPAQPPPAQPPPAQPPPAQPPPAQPTPAPTPPTQTPPGQTPPATPGPGQESAPGSDLPPAASTPAGRALLDKVVAAAGGAERLGAMRTLAWRGRQVRMTEQGAQGEVEIIGTVEFPSENYSLVLVYPTAQARYTVTAEAGWRELAGVVGDLSAAEAENFRAGLRLATTPLLVNHQTLRAVALSPEVVGGQEYEVLRVWRGTEGPVDFFVDMHTGLIDRKRWSVPVGKEILQREEKTWDYREINGCQMPFARKTFEEGKAISLVSITQFEIDKPLPPDLFRKPAPAPAPSDGKP